MYNRTVFGTTRMTRFLKYIAAARKLPAMNISQNMEEKGRSSFTRSNREHLPSAASSAELELTAHRLRVCPIRSGLLPLSSIRKTQPCFSYKKRRRDFGGVQNVPPVTKSAGAMAKDLSCHLREEGWNSGSLFAIAPYPVGIPRIRGIFFTLFFPNHSDCQPSANLTHPFKFYHKGVFQS